MGFQQSGGILELDEARPVPAAGARRSLAGRPAGRQGRRLTRAGEVRAERQTPNSQRSGAGARTQMLARIIHECFYCNRAYVAATGGLAAQSVDVLQKSTPSSLAAPSARFACRLRGFVTNHHE